MSDGNGDYLSLHGDISGGTWSARNIHLISEKKPLLLLVEIILQKPKTVKEMFCIGSTSLQNM